MGLVKIEHLEMYVVLTNFLLWSAILFLSVLAHQHEEYLVRIWWNKFGEYWLDVIVASVSVGTSLYVFYHMIV